MCLDSSRRLGSSNPTIELFTYKLGKIILSYVFSDVSLRLSTKKLTIQLMYGTTLEALGREEQI
ncbi:unnamed protein product [Rhodiola kirilowii]